MRMKELLIAMRHGALIRHDKGGVYKILESCKVKDGTTWKEGVLYTDIESGALYCRDVDNFKDFRVV